MRTPSRFALTGLLFLLPACSAIDRLENVGEAPALSPVAAPLAQPEYGASAIPMPRIEPAVYQPNSLWASGARSFFKDQRAARIGDILTVDIEIEDKAQVANTTSRARTNADSSGMANIFGFESYLGDILPGEIDPGTLVDVESDSKQSGTGTVNRAETIELTIAAVVTDVLPNGNLVIQGRQEVRVNYELRELLISGVVRPEDIANDNTIKQTQIAEARISYGGRGQITEVQQPRYGQQVLDILSPF